MQKYLTHLKQEHLVLFCCMLIITGFVLSRVMISIGVIGLVVCAIPILVQNKKYAFSKMTTFKAFPILTLIFFLVLFHAFGTVDWPYYLERLKIRLPFLFLPLAFALFIPFSKKQFSGLLYFLVIVMTLSGIKVLGNYLLHYEVITESFLVGKSIPTPYNHIRYSLLTAFAIIAGIHLVQDRFYLKWKWEKSLIIFCTTFLFILIHILSVRSGLLALYLALFYLIIRLTIVYKKYKTGLAILASLVLLPYIVYRTVPSFKNKVDYSIYDYKSYMVGKKKSYSDIGRFTSIEVGLALAKQSPLMGVGAGNLKKEVHAYYQKNLPQIKDKAFWKMPHNQFISILAGTGIIGLLIFLFALFYPLFYKKNYTNSLLVCFYLMFLTSFLSENTIEGQIGTTFFLIFLLIILNYRKGISISQHA